MFESNSNIEIRIEISGKDSQYKSGHYSFYVNLTGFSTC